LRADGFIIRAQAAIGTDGFTVRAGFGKTCARRAPTAFSARINGIRAENAVLVNSRNLVGFYPRSSISHGWLFHPCEIDDPRGRLLVRATSHTPTTGGAI